MKSESDTSFDRFAAEYDERAGDTGDYNHQHTIDPPLFELAGNPAGLAIYDIACGNGYISRKFMRGGAKEIWASDVSKELVRLATTKYPDMGIKYSARDAEDFSDIPKNHFDLVLIHMAIWYVEDVDSFLAKVYEVLKPGGKFIFSIDHPMKWSLYKAIGAVEQEETDREQLKYLEVRKTKTFNHWLQKQDDLSIYFRPMEYYINLCGKNNLLIKAIREPISKMLLKNEEKEVGIPMKMVIETIKI